VSDDLINHLKFYRDLGFTEVAIPERKAPPSPVVEAQPAVATLRPQVAATVSPVTETLQIIREDIGECTRCRLHEGRNQLVFGDGNAAAKLVFVGEGPGADEDAQGIPFVGRAGKLLTDMIEKTAVGEGIAIKRPDIYICNVVKCRPPENRAPEADEMATCGQFLERQLHAIQPKAICVLGATAAKALLETKIGITKLRGEWQDWQGIRVMPTFHPSYLLRAYNKEAKRLAWEDLKQVLHYVYD
jgi:uracil-DNA glycosylase family 4